MDASITMIPKSDGDATPLGQRPLSVLPVVYRVWASTRMSQLDDWFRSWVPDSVFSAGGGRGSVEAWYTSALDIEEVLSGASDSHVHLFVADVVKSFDTVDLWCRLLPFFSVILVVLLMVLVFFLILIRLMQNSEGLGFPTFAVLGKGRPALTNSASRFKGGCRFFLKSVFLG